MEVAVVLKLSLAIFLSQLALVVALFLDAWALGRVGPTALAHWAVVQPLWLCFQLAGTGCLTALDRVFANRPRDGAPDNALAGGILLGTSLALVSTFALFGVTACFDLEGGGALLRLMSLTLWLWLPFIVFRQYGVAEGRVRDLCLASLAGLALHALILVLLPAVEWKIPLAHALDRLLAVGILVAPMGAVSFPNGARKITLRAFEHFKEGAPLGGQLLARSMLFVLIAGWAIRLGPASLAAHGILSSLGNLVIMIPFSLSIVASVLVSARAGSGSGKMAELLRDLLVLTLTLSGVLSLIGYLGRERLLFLFTQDPHVHELAVTALPFVMAFVTIDSFEVVLTGVFRGLGETRQPFTLYMASFLFLGLPAAFLLSHSFGFGIQGIWSGLCLGAIALNVLMVCKLRGIFVRRIDVATLCYR